jgi:hypothetical protein
MVPDLGAALRAAERAKHGAELFALLEGVTQPTTLHGVADASLEREVRARHIELARCCWQEAQRPDLLATLGELDGEGGSSAGMARARRYDR